MATEWQSKFKIRKKKPTQKNNISSEVIRGLKPNLCRTVHNINLYKTCVFIAAGVLTELFCIDVC